jgi:hypothetical protein
VSIPICPQESGRLRESIKLGATHQRIYIEGTVEELGTVDVIDLVARNEVASVEVGQQAGGMDFL